MDLKALLLVAVWIAFADSIPVKQDPQDTDCPQCRGAIPSHVNLNLPRGPKRKYCGVKDVRLKRGSKRLRRYVLRGMKWDKKLITWRLYNFTPKLAPAYTLKAIRKAFRQWEMHSGLTIKQVVTGSADIAISFEPKRHYIFNGLFCNIDFDGPGGTIGHAFYPLKDAVYAGNIHMDGEEIFSTDGSFGFNFESAIMHEIGHSLGLMHTYGYDAIMNPDYAMSAKGMDLQLHLDDIDGIQALYGPPEATKEIENSVEENPVEDAERQKAIKETKKPVQTIPEVNNYINEDYNANQQTYHEHEATVENQIEVPNETKEITMQKEASQASVLVPKQMLQEWIKGGHSPISNQEILLRTSGLNRPLCPDRFEAIYVSSNNLDTYVFNKFFEYSLGPWLGYQGLTQNIRTKFLFPNVDAVYRRIKDNKLIMFSGQLYAVYQNDTILEKYGGIFDFGFPYATKRIDAALTFGPYRNTYFFVGDEYWRYNEKYQSMDPGYPKKISSVWKGVPAKVDAAITWKNGRTYFFKGNKYYRINTRTAAVENGYPKSIKVWTKCHLYSKKTIDS